ncbi:polysaccharide deacetylase family protein [Streptococcus macacae]|uniref:Polysaccharide deacetylase n=1 Tax=Streptococcus macacae NCTC 11558 TaxID=764298 RepID=G5JVT3_9STRE|nr:polysaccharide deacetylase family protein [Streptococcus macacae]EHJ51576.1 polysaccharide deacetylase [Streptococcus macacae NCTC 11558]SUN78925.1 deacetylase [Streptococcus macacae NCTC 11558]
MKYQQYWKKIKTIFSSKDKQTQLLFIIGVTGLILGIGLAQMRSIEKSQQIHPLAQAVRQKHLPPKPTALMPDHNHNNKAKNYAYPTQSIRNMMENQKKLKKGKLVFLTFDDGVDPKMTPRILDVLSKYRVPATFFVLGCNINQWSAPILKRQIAEGHAIGIHSFSHNYSLLYPNRIGNTKQILAEADKTQDLLKKQLGKRFKARVFRYPGGHLSWSGLEAADKQLSAKGIQWMDWNAMVGDAEPEAVRPKSVAKMLAYLDGTVKASDNPNIQVVLMHDISSKDITLASLPNIIQYYKNRGYTFGVLE